MKLTVFILTVFCMSVTAKTHSQTVSYSGKNVSLEKVLKEVMRQTGYAVFYDKGLLKKAKPVTVNAKSLPMADFLQKVLSDQLLEFEIENRTIVISEKAAPADPQRTSSFLTFDLPIDVRGRIINDKGEPAAGVTITVKGNTRATSTDNNGEFNLTGIDGQSTLIITGANIETYEIRVNDKAILSITVTQKVSDLDEAVVVAYGKTTNQALTGAVSVVKSEQLVNQPNLSVDRSLQGLVPGLQITTGSGQPGGGVANIIIRGIGTGTEALSGSTVRSPLFVVDGVPVTQDHMQSGMLSITETPATNPMAQLNPADIESVSVLKDAAAIALYGSKASNGVILITTKSGKAGKTKYTFSQKTDIASRIKGKVELLNQEDYLELVYESYKNADPVKWTDEAIRADLVSKFAVKSNGEFYPVSDWASEIFVNSAVALNNNFSISGGNNSNRFYLNFEYTTQDGVVKNTSYDRSSIRFNYENIIAPGFKVGMNSTLSYSKQDIGSAWQYIDFLYKVSPLNPARNEAGNYILQYPVGAIQYSIATNPAASLDYNFNRNTNYRGLTNMNLEATFLKDFTITSLLGADFMLTELKVKNDPRIRSGSLAAGIGAIQDRDLRRTALINNNILRWNKTIGAVHHLNLLVGQEAQIQHQKTMYIAVQGLRLPNFDQINNGAQVTSAQGNLIRQTLLSYFGQANYDYGNKYFLTASVRKDGSSKFGNEKRYGTYWSSGAAWVISNEKFMKNTSSWIDYLKVRGSIGQAGNSAAIDYITRFDQLNVLNINGGDTAVYSYAPANKNIQWETTFNTDLGIELGFFKRIRITADLYKRKISNLIFETDLAPVTGFEGLLENIGNMENKGAEIAVQAAILQSKKLSWNISVNWSTNKNKLVKSFFPLRDSRSGLLVNKEGENFGSFYLREWAGVNAENGKPQWIGEDGKPTSTYSEAPKKLMGKPQPDGYGGITNTFGYHGFQLSVFLYYQYGFLIYDNTATQMLNDGAIPYFNQSVKALDRWQKPGDIAANPRRMLNSVDYGNQPSSRFLSDGDFVRLKYIRLAYDFPSQLLRKWSLSSLNLFFQGNNLGFVTKYKGIDPENADSGGGSLFTYPQQKSFTAGLNIVF